LNHKSQYISFFLWIKWYNSLTKKVGLIKVHSRNLMHCVLVYASHQAPICSYWIEFGSINWHFLSFLTLVNVGSKFKLWMSCFVSCLIIFVWQHHGLSHMHKFLWALITSCHMIFVKVLWWSEKMFTVCLGTYCSNSYRYSSSYHDTFYLCFASLFIPSHT
jgi:hypothetical protein